MPDAYRDCETCLWWEPVDDDGKGFCRRYAPRPSAPRPSATKSMLRDANWPLTYSDDWCGEWQPEAVAQVRETPPAS